MTTAPESPNAVDDDGRRTGGWTEPDPHGGVIVGEYLEGERHGTWRHYSTVGRLRSEGGYDRGELHGPWTWYRATGGLLQRGGFHHGEKYGRWERWNPAGGLIDSGTWEQGKRSGEWTSYRPDGTAKRVTTHRARLRP